jgi:hypothetical protein
LDVAKANMGNPAISQGSKQYTGGSTVNVFGEVYATFEPYYSVAYGIATANGSSSPQNTDTSGIAFDGWLSNSVITDLGDFMAIYPPSATVDDTIGIFNKNRTANQIGVSAGNIIYASSGDGGEIGLQTFVNVGMDVKLVTLAENGDPGSTINIADVSACILSLRSSECLFRVIY